MPGRRRPDTAHECGSDEPSDDDVTAIRAVVEAAYALYVPRIGRAPAPMTADYEALVAAGEVWVGERGRTGCRRPRDPASDDALELENVAVDPGRAGARPRPRARSRSPSSHARELGLDGGRAVHERGDGREPRLYPRLGFVETGRRVEDGYRRVYFRKTLDARELPR